jgi:hypothetical protein
MIGGFALIAYPAEYGNSGAMTFRVNHAGTVYQKDSGKLTESIAQRIYGGLDQPSAYGLHGDVTAHRQGRATLGLDHFDGAAGERRIEIGHHHLGAGARQQDRRSPAVADAVTRSTPTADDRDLAGKTGILVVFHARSCDCLSTISIDGKDIALIGDSNSVPDHELRRCDQQTSRVVREHHRATATG